MESGGVSPQALGQQSQGFLGGICSAAQQERLWVKWGWHLPLIPNTPEAARFTERVLHREGLPWKRGEAERQILDLNHPATCTSPGLVWVTLACEIKTLVCPSAGTGCLQGLGSLGHI